MKLLRIPERMMAEYLGDRPRDHRVKYMTPVSNSKTYAANSPKLVKTAEEVVMRHTVSGSDAAEDDTL